jgi:hypothetical protein
VVGRFRSHNSDVVVHDDRVDDMGLLIEPIGLHSTDMHAVVDLSDRNRRTLGQLPYAVFTEAAAKSWLLVARSADGGPPLGYALYRLPRNEVSLTHLCVSGGAREHGVARALVDEISARHGERLGIRAKCRDDYKLDQVWASMGFEHRANTTGRGRDRASMTVWWKDHGHADLFTQYEQPFELRAAIDLNIVRDLADPDGRGHRSEFLVADHLADRLQLVVTSGMLAEIERVEPQRGQPLRDALDEFPILNAPLAEVALLRERIADAVKSRRPNYPRTLQDHADLDQVAHASAAGVGVFLTWDEGLVNTLGPVVADLTGLKIMVPEYVVVHLDELANAESFVKESLEGSEFIKVRAGTDVENHLDTFVAKADGERRSDLRDLVRRFAGDVEFIQTADGVPILMFAVESVGRTLRVPLLRLINHRLADTFARHLLWSIRQRAKVSGAVLVDIYDPYLSSRIARAAEFEAMIHADSHWFAPVVAVTGTSQDVSAAANESFKAAGIGAPPLLGPKMSAHATARLEHAWWPAKIMDSELPCFVVPIQAQYAMTLFGFPGGLPFRDAQLSLGREHVYYHSVVNSVLRAPARILWYASGQGPGSGHFFAVSTLNALQVDTPQDLHDALSYYGVFDLSAIAGAAKGKPQAEALRLSNTEVFGNPVRLSRYRLLLTDLGGGSPTFPCARRLSPDLFAAMYTEGQHTAGSGA